MTVRKPCPEAPGPPEAYARQFDACFGTLAQRRADAPAEAGAPTASELARRGQGRAGTGRDGQGRSLRG